MEMEEKEKYKQREYAE